jgi:pullulanase/glycogen debranching enzyme
VKLLLDPYARAIEGEVRFGPEVYGYAIDDLDAPSTLDSAGHVPRSLVVDPSFDWTDCPRPRHIYADTVLYEVHVKGFTAAHPAVPEPLQGTYAGLGHDGALAHLVGDDFLLLINAWWEPLDFLVPSIRADQTWHPEIDAYGPSSVPIPNESTAGDRITVQLRSIVVLRGNPNPASLATDAGVGWCWRGQRARASSRCRGGEARYQHRTMDCWLGGGRDRGYA